MDAWLREAEEASQWVEEMENIMNHNNLNFSVSIVHSSRSKLLELGVKLDRLESLLRNPPPKPILTDEDLDFRWKMFSDIQLRTRTLARSLYALPLPNRPRNASPTASKEYDVSLGYYDQAVGIGLVVVIAYYASLYSFLDLLQTSYSQGQSELPKPLLSESDDANRTQIQPLSFMSRISLWKACSTILFFLGLAALVFLVVLICAAI